MCLLEYHFEDNFDPPADHTLPQSFLALIYLHAAGILIYDFLFLDLQTC